MDKNCCVYDADATNPNSPNLTPNQITNVSGSLGPLRIVHMLLMLLMLLVLVRLLLRLCFYPVSLLCLQQSSASVKKS